MSEFAFPPALGALLILAILAVGLYFVYRWATGKSLTSVESDSKESTSGAQHGAVTR
jgi:hypothetical protein